MTSTSSVDVTVLDQLVEEVSERVSRGGTEHEVTDDVAAALKRALDAGLELDPAVMAPDPERYVMYPLHVAPDRSFSIAAAVWNVGQGTPVHDHSVWGVVGIHSGVEHERRYRPPAPDADGRLGLLDHSDWGPGAVTICCTSDQDLHEVSCASDTPVVGIHIYGGDIGTIRRRSYDKETGEVSFFVSHWATPVDRGN